ncbi:MAG: NUDIX hydrolase [Bacteroidales bacterium]|nr:NUDIX hydrolase [Bacteroidales bacterium]
MGTYTYNYPRPMVTTDCTVFNSRGQILLILRCNNPFANHWALPGGFVEETETVEQGAVRELLEETSIRASVADLHLVGVYSRPHRDPRGRTITIAYLLMLPDEGTNVQANDDASSAQWFDIDALPPLAFDHDNIIADAVAFLAAIKHQ